MPKTKRNHRPMTDNCKKVYNAVMEKYDPTKPVDLDLLYFMFAEIDRVHYDHHFKRFFRKHKTKFDIKWKETGTTAATAAAKFDHKEYHMTFCKSVFDLSYREFRRHLGLDFWMVANGRACRDIVQCFMRVMEHETVHFYMYTYDDFKEDHEGEFQSTAVEFFEHTQFYHHLTTKSRYLQNKGISHGVKVKFKKNGRVYRGVVQKIKQKIWVLVEKDIHKMNVDALEIDK